MQEIAQQSMPESELQLAVEEKARQDAYAGPAVPQNRDPFFVYFNLRENKLEVSHSSAFASSPRSLFSQKQIITNIVIDLLTGKQALEQAFTREFNPKTNKVESKVIATDPATVAELRQKAGIAFAAWHARYQ